MGLLWSQPNQSSCEVHIRISDVTKYIEIND